MSPPGEKKKEFCTPLGPLEVPKFLTHTLPIASRNVLYALPLDSHDLGGMGAVGTEAGCRDLSAEGVPRPLTVSKNLCP